MAGRPKRKRGLADHELVGADAEVPVSSIEVGETVTIPRAEYEDLKRKALDLEHALARETQKPEPVPVEKPKERKFRCKLCKIEFKSFDKRPACPQKCSYSWERRTGHNDFITTEVVPDEH